MLVAVCSPVYAASNFNLDIPYPSNPDSLTADEIITHTWFVNHFRAVNNYAVKQNGEEITWLAYKTRTGKFRFRTLERFLYNEQDRSKEIFSKDLVVFHYPGAIDGTGILINDYVDTSKQQSVNIWLPALRKPRRFAEPSHEDAYAGTDWTFGDVSLRKPTHETHELLRKENFSEAEGGNVLRTVDIPEDQNKPFMNWLPDQSMLKVDRECHVIKSTTKFKDFWYDYRISWIDTRTFADYRTLYYKNNKLIKWVDRLWLPMRNHKTSPDIDDPRAQYWVMWYGKTLRTGHETMAIVPPDVNVWNGDIDSNFWSLQTLEKLKR
jgi:hypothetical protein